MLILSFAEKLHTRVCAALIQYMMVQWSICSLYIHIDTYFLEGKHVVAAGVVCHWFVTHTRACALSFSLTHECALFFLSLSLSLSLSLTQTHTVIDACRRQSASVRSSKQLISPVPSPASSQYMRWFMDPDSVIFTHKRYVSILSVTVKSRSQRNKSELCVFRRTLNAPTCLYNGEWPLVEALINTHLSSLYSGCFHVNSPTSLPRHYNIRGCPTLRNNAPIPPWAVGKHTTAVRSRTAAPECGAAGEEIRERRFSQCRSPAPLETSPLRLLPSFHKVIVGGKDGVRLHTGRRHYLAHTDAPYRLDAL